ncbi:UDP-N-acetylmuramate--L-alanine ligase [Flavitalea flava]
MMDLKDIKKVYFIGIGGIGMSALARYFKGQGKEVSGYDKTATALTRQLAAEGIGVHYEDKVTQAPKDVDLVVYTPAVPKDHKELQFYQQHQYPLLKRSEVLGVITRSSFNICVAGTHGKTTITTMIAHILRHSGYGCNAFLGGIAVNYNSNFWSDPRNVCVVEADEYDRSFLRLFPDIAVISAMDADHLDIYGTADEVEKAFIEFSGKVKPGGLLLSKKGLARNAELKGDRHLTYGLEGRPAGSRNATENKDANEGNDGNDGSPDICATGITMKEGSYMFGVKTEDWSLDKIVLNMGGMHNVENVTVAIGVAHQLGITDEKIKQAVEAFRGVKRRFEYIVKTTGRLYIDDYAHHPEELRALISGARGLFPGLKCTVIFQPHLFTRTRDFTAGFAESLDLADEVFLLPIYPAREKPIEGVTSEIIVALMDKGKATVCDKEELLKILTDKVLHGDDLELVITAGAGDIDTLVEPIGKVLKEG